MHIKYQISNIKNVLNSGYVMLITTVIFVMVSVLIVFGIATPIAKQIFAARDIWSAKQSRYLSEAGAEDVMYRLKDSTMASKVSGTETLTLDGYNTITTISTNGISKTISALSDQNGYKKNIETTVIQGSGTSFNYGILTGDGGFVITGGSKVVGNIYSNGDILGGAGIIITGSAIAASGGNIFKDQANETPTSSPSSITFNNALASRDFAQSFQPASTSAIHKVSIYIQKTGTPTSFTVNIMSDSSGNPGTVLATSTLFSTDVTTSLGWVDLVITKAVTLTANTTYWLVIQGTATGASSNTYTVGANNTYARGQAKTGKVGSTWNTTSLDGYFDLYLGSTPSKIYGNEGDYLYIGSSSTDRAWAADVSHVKMTAGNMYCLTGTNNYNGKVCDTSLDMPDVQPMPTSQANIDSWKAEALAGGTTSGDVNIDWAGGIIGPRKITGNLLVNGGGTLSITGTLWVQGSITVTGGGKIKVSPSLGGTSAVIVTDKYASIDGGAQFEGSGTTGSYPILVSTSVCPNTTPCATNSSAIYLSGGAGAVVLDAPFGKVNVIGGSGARSVTGDSIYIDGGGVVTYETGLANLSFSSGPSGGWQISGWKELEN